MKYKLKIFKGNFLRTNLFYFFCYYNFWFSFIGKWVTCIRGCASTSNGNFILFTDAFPDGKKWVKNKEN